MQQLVESPAAQSMYACCSGCLLFANIGMCILLRLQLLAGILS